MNPVWVVVAVALGTATFFFHPSAAWIESTYANGIYPAWEHAVFPFSNALPWSLGDLAVLLVVPWLAWRWHLCWHSLPIARRKRVLRMFAELVAAAGFYLFWFDVSWGWNYDRAPIETRVAYDASRVTPAALDALRNRVVAHMNRLAPLAHAAPHRLDLATLYDAWLPVVQAGGDRWTPVTGAPKPTLADPFMNATGTSGFVNPFALTVQLASDDLWFERPFDLAHEWTHVAAYAREDEANYVAAVACTRSNDPVIAYSGWLELFTYLPPLKSYPKSMFVPQVWHDFAAIRARNAKRINLTLANLSWRTYNVYLKSNHVAAGVQNYNEVTRLYLGVALDASGVPEQRS